MRIGIAHGLSYSAGGLYQYSLTMLQALCTLREQRRLEDDFVIFNHGENGLDMSGLAERGVETRMFFLGMHEQPVFHRMGLFHDEKYPVAERLARQGLYLPSGLALTDAQMDEVCRAVRGVLEG